MGITYYSNRAGVATIPTPVKASSILELQRAMMTLNKRHRGTVFYMGPPQWVESEKSWYAWYYIEQTVDDQLKGAVDGNN